MREAHVPQLEGSPCLPQLKKAHREQGRPSAAKKREKFRKDVGHFLCPISHFVGHFLLQPLLQQPSFFRYNSQLFLSVLALLWCMWPGEAPKQVCCPQHRQGCCPGQSLVCPHRASWSPVGPLNVWSTALQPNLAGHSLKRHTQDLPQNYCIRISACGV